MPRLVPAPLACLPLLFSKLGVCGLTCSTWILFIVESARVMEQVPSGCDPFAPGFLPGPKHRDLSDSLVALFANEIC